MACFWGLGEVGRVSGDTRVTVLPPAPISRGHPMQGQNITCVPQPAMIPVATCDTKGVVGGIPRADGILGRCALPKSACSQVFSASRDGDRGVAECRRD